MAATDAFIETYLIEEAYNSSDPHLMLLAATWMPASTEGREPEIRAFLLMERALALAPRDPVVLIHLDSHCDTTLSGWSECAVHDWPALLAALEPDNGAPWLRIAARRSARGDLRGARAALEEAATRPRFDTWNGKSVHDLYQALRRLAPPGAALHPISVAVRAIHVSAQSVNYEAELGRACAGQHDFDALCLRLAVRMLDRGLSVLGMTAAAQIVLRDSRSDEADRARASAVQETLRSFSLLPDSLVTEGRINPGFVEHLMDQYAVRGEFHAWRDVYDNL